MDSKNERQKFEHQFINKKKNSIPDFPIPQRGQEIIDLILYNNWLIFILSCFY